jgi:hypothetical protein
MRGILRKTLLCAAMVLAGSYTFAQAADATSGASEAENSEAWSIELTGARNDWFAASDYAAMKATGKDYTEKKVERKGSNWSTRAWP